MIEKERIAFLVGMPRAATTFLYHNFNLHPEIFVPYRRKTNYFSLHPNAGEDWFLSHFKDAPENAVIMDTETLAFVNADLNSPELIRQFNKNAKIILCVRDPAAWAVSFYNQISTFDSEMPEFEQFLAGDYTLVEDGKAISFNMGEGSVSARFKEYEQLFPNSILILKFPDVIESPLTVLQKIEHFLGISSFYSESNIITKKINSSDRKHNKFINKILRNEQLITLVKKLLPRDLVLFIRLKFDTLSSSKSNSSEESSMGAEFNKMLALAQTHYRTDIKELEKYIY